MVQKHKFRESRMPFPLRDIRKKSSQHVRAYAAGDGAICSKMEKLSHIMGPNPIIEANRARLQSPSPIMAPVLAYDLLEDRRTIDVIITKCLPLCFKMTESFENLDNIRSPSLGACNYPIFLSLRFQFTDRSIFSLNLSRIEI